MQISLSNFQDTLVTDGHASEGFLVTVSNGDIIHFFRLEPGLEGDHVGPGGKLVKRRYSNGAWGQIETTYDSEYDDRNLHGGITRDGRIVMFFRRSIITGGSISSDEGYYHMYSDDEGETWSGMTKITDSKAAVWGTGQMFYNPEIDRYCMFGYIHHYLEVRFSQDGSDWSERVIIADNITERVSEVAGAYCGNGRMILLTRDDRRSRGHTLIQMTSRDNGQTWSNPSSTNIPPDLHWGSAPQILFDDNTGNLIAMTSDRRSMYEGSSARSEERLWIFHAKPNEIFDDPQNWTYGTSFIRPITNANFNFYGYPVVAKLSSNSYLVVYTDRYHLSNGTEQANLYQFEMELISGGIDEPGLPSSSVISGIPMTILNGKLETSQLFVKKGNGLRKQTSFLSNS